jgi:protein-S-isoprenylcysteine O-methyltransferase Ste14
MPHLNSRSFVDHPGVILPPPLIYLLGFITSLALNRRWPLPIIHGAAGRWAGLLLVVLAIALALFARSAMRRAGTNINPYKPTSTIVTSGPFRCSRNPLYVALTVLFVGLTFLSNTWWGVLLLLPIAVVMHWGVVLREERYLKKKFGVSYIEYRNTVRRYF